ncbi:hypothetical protein FG386_003553 [Cryptosporidium ryanae]|uniref:uncharacterized protein n=1 Tax=Cryptosporidium ryanae TaxID=515981 RepID=UPI00351A5E19|nr:hypothetical protein FG386_003553 [Cryptosporidium ryanae]
MISNFYDEQVRNTIKLLHKKLLKLFYLENVCDSKLLNEISSAISESTEYGISQCVDIIIPPIIMAIHKYIKNENHVKSQNYNSKELNTKFSLNYLNITFIEELFKILHNVLYKINSTEDIVSNRISMIFYDIMFPIAQTFRICNIWENDFLINLLIKIVNLDFYLFWKNWKYDVSDSKGQHLIIPVIVDCLLSISLTRPNENKNYSKCKIYSKDTKKISLELLSKIPNIINDNEILIKIFPGVIQAVSLQILNIDLDNTPIEVIELSLKTFLEWFNYCINDKVESIYPKIIISSTINTGKIVQHILNFKSSNLSLNTSFKNTDQNEQKSEKLRTIRNFFIEIAISCLNSFEIFIKYSENTLVTCIDFLFSMCQDKEENSIITFLKFLNGVFQNINSNQKLEFLKNYFSKISDHFECGIFDNKKRKDYGGINMYELLNLISRDYGVLFIRNQVNISSYYLNTENMLNSFFENFISDNSFESYEKNILKYSNEINKFNTKRFSVCCKEDLTIETLDVYMEITDIIFSCKETYQKSTFNCDFDVLDNISIFEFVGDVITSIFCEKICEHNISKLKSFSLLVLNMISILLMNLKNETITSYVADLFKQKFSRINSNKSNIKLFTNFLIYFILCYLSEYLINFQIKDANKPYHFSNKNNKEISELLYNLFDFTMKEFSEEISFNIESIHSIINVNILLVLMGNIIKIANNIEHNKKIYTLKFNSIIFNLFSCFYSRINITHNNAKFVLVQFSTLLGSDNCSKSEIRELLVDHSIDLLRPLETIFYNEINSEKIQILYFLVSNCKIELLLELDDFIEKITKINVKENMWIFEFIFIISHRLSSELYSSKKKLTSELISNYVPNIMNLKEEIYVNFKGTGENIKKMIFIFCLEFNVFFRNISETVTCTMYKNVCNDLSKNDHIKEDFSNKYQSNDLNLEMPKIKTIVNKLIPITRLFSFNNDYNEFSIQKYQYFSVNALINCLNILSRDEQNLLPEASRIVSHAINSWKRLIHLFIYSTNSEYEKVSMNIREICIINQILIRLIVSCEYFVVKKLEENLVPLLLDFIEFILINSKKFEFMDDKEDKLNSTIYILGIQAINLLKYFTKQYSKQSVIKFEILNGIVGKFISPVIGNYSIYWRLVSTEIIITLFKVFPFVIKAHLRKSIVEINDHISTISFITKYISESCFSKKDEKLSWIVDLITNTGGESLLISKINSI